MAIGGSNSSRAGQATVHGVCGLMIVTLWAVSSWGAETSSTKPETRVRSDLQNGGVNPYSKLSNEQLGTLAGTFEELDRDQRRWFLTEVRKRMSIKGDRPRIEVDKDDRFGRDAGRANKASGDLHTPAGRVPVREGKVEETKVYGTGPPTGPGETADGSTPALQSKDPPVPSE